MERILHHFKKIYLVLLLFAFSVNVKAQCSITGTSPNASAYNPNPCVLLSGCGGVLYVGDGINPTNLIMNTALNLTCLGSIQLIIRNNSSIDFSSGNDYLTLAAGSSILFEGTGTLIGGSCNASERIYIGSELIASCNGNAAADYSFPELISQGGYNIVNASINPTSVCGSGSFSITATATPSSGATIKWFTVPSGGSSISTGNTYTTPVISASTTYYVEAYYSSTGFTTPRKAVVATVNPLPVITTQPVTQLDCEGASVNFTTLATGTGLTYTWQRKKPTDASFITIPVEGNISYPSAGKIKIDNVGSSQSPSGTQYQVVVTTSSGCSVTSSAATLLVNEITGISPSATTVTQCYGTNYSYTVSTSTPPPGSVVSYQWKSSVTSGVWNNVVNGTHFSGANSATLNILNGTPAQSAEYKVQVIFTSSGANCNVTTALNRQITFLPEITAPVATITQPDCITPTGSVTLSGLPAIGTWTLKRSGTSSATTTGTGTSTTISGLATGTYNFTVSDGTCTSLATADVVIQPVTTAIWNGSAWINGPPTINQPLEFTGTYNSSGDLTACSCTVTSGAVTFNSGHTLKITNWVHVNGGSLTFENNASLVQINNVPNTGNIKYKRLTTAIRNTDYTYWSSPVAGFTLGGVSPNTLADKFYSFDSTIEDWKQESAATSMVAGVGYIVRGPQLSTYMPPFPANLYQATFLGVPNNGHYEITGVVADKSYLLGNPYPSALDADTFLDDNSSVLDGTLYFWTHNTPIAIGTPNPGSGLYAYSGDDYASYNRTGGTATAAAPSASTGGLNINIPSGKIASGQGFFGSSKISITGSTIVFNNSMRVGVGSITGSNDQFYRTKNPKNKTTTQLEKHRIWLDLTNSQGAFKQTLIGYITGATNDYEGRFDGESYDGNDFLDFYSVLQDKNLAIQGRALPFDENDEIPLGYRVAIGGTFTIKIGQTDGLMLNKEVLIEDQLTHIVSDLKSGSYTFSTEAGTFDNRFVLRYRDKTLSVDQPDTNDGIIVLYSNNYKTLIVRNNLKDTTVNSITLFNMSGQKIADWNVKESEQTTIQIPIKNVNPEIYIVKVKTDKGETGKKIVIK